MNTRKHLVLPTLVLALLGAGAKADVTFDPSTGQGFIGRGDVIAHLGKGGLVPNPTIIFISGVNQTFEVTWEWTTGQKEVKVHSNTQRIELAGTLPVTMSTRTANGKVANHITGYLLASEASISTGEQVPAVGDTKAGPDGSMKTCISVVAVSEAGLTEAGTGELWFYTDAAQTYGVKLPFTVPVAADSDGDL
jgi:hypothetical protein